MRSNERLTVRQKALTNLIFLFFFVIFLHVLSAILGVIAFGNPEPFGFFLLGMHLISLCWLVLFMIWGNKFRILRFAGIYFCVMLTCINLSLLLIPAVIDIMGVKSSLLFSNFTQFPLDQKSVSDTNTSGELFVAINKYSRIQKYDPQGNFVSGWFIRTGGRRFSLWVGDDDKVNVCIRRYQDHLIFSPRGQLIEEISVSSKEMDRLFETASKNNIVLKSDSCFMQNLVGNRIFRYNAATDDKQIVLATPGYFLFFNIPFPVLLYLCISTSIAFVFHSHPISP